MAELNAKANHLSGKMPLNEMFHVQAAKTPNRLAVQDDGASLVLPDPKFCSPVFLFSPLSFYRI